MKYNHKPLKNIDIDIDIDVETNVVNDKENKENTICYICRIENDFNSKKLDFCQCKNLYHLKCIDEIKKKYKKCPICKKSQSQTQTQTNTTNTINSRTSIITYNEELLNRIKLIFGIIIMILFLWYMANIFLNFIGLFFNFELLINDKYCDNKYIMCDYFLVSGKLVSNKLEIKYDNFNVQYILSSSYDWTNNTYSTYSTYSTYNTYNPINNYENKICVDLDTHIYDSYETALIVKEKSIGEIKNFYVSFANYADCKLNYLSYNPYIYYYYLSLKINIYSMIIFFMIRIYIDTIYPNYNIPINLINRLLVYTHNFFGICWIFTLFVIDYYSYYILV